VQRRGPSGVVESAELAPMSNLVVVHHLLLFGFVLAIPDQLEIALVIAHSATALGDASKLLLSCIDRSVRMALDVAHFPLLTLRSCDGCEDE
jgi:hypothetical protein